MWASTISGISTCPHVLSLFDVLSGRYRPAVHMHERDIPSGFRLNSNHISTGIGIIGSCYSSAYRGIMAGRSPVMGSGSAVSSGTSLSSSSIVMERV